MNGERTMINFSNCDIDLSVNYNGANGKRLVSFIIMKDI